MPSKNPIDQIVQMSQPTPQPRQQTAPTKNNLPNSIASQFACYVKAGIQLLVWSVIAVAALASGYVAIRGIWAAVKMILAALGVEGGV
jgi:hypothetical protein